MSASSTKRIQPARGWCATVKRDCANCIHLILPLRRLRPPVFVEEASHATPHHGWQNASSLRETLSQIQPKPTLKTLLHTLTKYTNSPVQPSQSSPPSLSPAHSPPNSPTFVQSHMPPLQNTPTYHRASIERHTYIHKQYTGPLDVSREGGASASQVERTPGMATLTY